MEQLQIICLGSGSSGNCYLLGKGNEYVMLECGLPYKTIIARLCDYDISLEQIKAVAVSHSHKDHALALPDFESLGLPIYAPFVAGSGFNINKPFELTKWLRVRAFPVEHDVECYGFIFLTTDNESLLFVTDTKYIKSEYFNYKYNYIMLECNHIRKQLEAIMNQALLNGDQAKVFKFKRQATFHLSLAGVKKILGAMNLENTNAIFLLHLSKDCCNDDLIKKEISAKFKKPTFVCYRSGGIN